LAVSTNRQFNQVHPHSQADVSFPHIQLNLPRDSITGLARCLI